MFSSSDLPEKLKLRLREQTQGELTVRLIRTNFCDTFENPYLDRIIAQGKKAFFVVCPHRATVQDLKLRLSGLCLVPPRLLVLYYEGNTLLDNDAVPREAFEFTSYEDSDDDVFKPRIYMEVMYDPDDPDAPETSHQRNLREVREKARVEAQEQALALEAAAALQKKEEEAAARLQAFEEKIRRKEERAHFDLEGELAKINCGLHFEAMRDAGLQDEGAFSTMAEELLAGPGMWIPRLARIRILSLRDAFNRKNEMVYQAKHGSHYHEVEAYGRDWVGADGKHFKTKKELEDYQLKQDAAEAARLKRLRDGPQPKKHASNLQERIDTIRINEERDEDGMLVKDAYRMIYEPSKFCCKNHQIVSTKSRDSFLDMRLRGHAAEFEVAIAEADVYKNGFLPRELLSLLATIQCDKLLRAATTKEVPEHETLTAARISPDGPSDRSPEASPVRPIAKQSLLEERRADEAARRREKHALSKKAAYDGVERVLSQCLLSASAQDAGVNWAGPKEMFANVGGIPTERYNTSLFVEKMLDVFRAIDHDRYLLESQW